MQNQIFSNKKTNIQGNVIALVTLIHKIHKLKETNLVLSMY